MPYTQVETQKLFSSSFSEEVLAVLDSRKEFVDARAAINTLAEAEAVIHLGQQLLEHGLKLEDMDYASALMFAISTLSVNVVLEDYSVLHFKYHTELELAHDLERWTHGDQVKRHIPGSHILESYLEDPVVDTFDSRAEDR